MKSILRAQRRSSIAAAAVTILLGVALVWWPGRSVRLLCTLLGLAIFVTGIIYLLGWIARGAEERSALLLLPGVILCAVGVWLIASPESVVVLVQYIFGAILIFHGVVDVQGAMALMRRGWWWLDLALAAVTIALGALILINPFAAFRSLVTIIGLALIFDGVSDLYLIWRLSRAFRSLEEDDNEW